MTALNFPGALDWCAPQRVTRLQFIVQNRRFLVLTPKGQPPNLASQAMGVALRGLSDHWRDIAEIVRFAARLTPAQRRRLGLPRQRGPARFTRFPAHHDTALERNQSGARLCRPRPAAADWNTRRLQFYVNTHARRSGCGWSATKPRSGAL